MAKSHYPTAADLEEFLEDAGFTTTNGWGATGFDLTHSVGTGISRFERMTGRTMLAPTATAIRYYDPPSNRRAIIDLEGDLAALTSVQYMSEAGVFSSSWTENTDFWLLPYNAPQRGRPYRMLEVTQQRYWGWGQPLPLSLRRAIHVTERWGFGTTIPDDAWDAMMTLAALRLLPRLIHLRFQGMISWEEAGVEESYGQDPVASLGKAWETYTQTVVNDYKDVMVGITS